MTVIPNFYGISTGRYIYRIMFVIQGDVKGQKDNSKVKFIKKKILINTQQQV